jgi:hypothetical protein
MTKQVKVLLGSFGLFDKVIVYVKDEGVQLNIPHHNFNISGKLFFVETCHSFIGSCFGHVTFKATQYATNDFKICSGFIEVCLKETQVALQKTIILK